MPYQGGGNYGGGGYGGGGGGGYGGRFDGGGRGRGRGGGGGGRRNYEDGDPDPNSEQFRKLFVGGLSYDTDEDGLKAHFEQWGEMTDCVVMRDPATKRSRGFGFITYKEASMIDEAQNNRPHKIDSREVETKRAMPRDAGANSSSHQTVTKMFIGGMKDDTTEDQIKECFEPYGKISAVEVVLDKATGKVRGFAFVTFDDYDSVDKAVLKKRHDLNGRNVEVKKAVSKDQMDGNSRGGMGGRGRGRGDNYGGGYGNSGYGGGGGYGGGNFGGGGYGGGGGGGYGGQSYGGGGYGDYNSSWNGGGGNFGSGYGGDYSGGPMKSGGYGARGQGPYGGGYGQQSYGGGGGGGYSRR